MLEALPRIYQVTPDIPDRRRATKQNRGQAPARADSLKESQLAAGGTLSCASDVTDDPNHNSKPQGGLLLFRVPSGRVTCDDVLMKPLLLAAVHELARPPDEQVKALEGMSVDELALDLDAQPWHDEPTEVRAALDELDAALSAMSGPDNAHLWTPKALHRRMARDQGNGSSSLDAGNAVARARPADDSSRRRSGPLLLLVPPGTHPGREPQPRRWHVLADGGNHLGRRGVSKHGTHRVRIAPTDFGGVPRAAITARWQGRILPPRTFSRPLVPCCLATVTSTPPVAPV